MIHRLSWFSDRSRSLSSFAALQSPSTSAPDPPREPFSPPGSTGKGAARMESRWRSGLKIVGGQHGDGEILPAGRVPFEVVGVPASCSPPSVDRGCPISACIPGHLAMPSSQQRRLVCSTVVGEVETMGFAFAGLPSWRQRRREIFEVRHWASEPGARIARIRRIVGLTA